MKILTAIARTAARLCDARDAQIYLVEGATMRLVAQHGSVRTTRRLGEPFPVSRGAVHGRAVLTRRVIHVRDLKTAVRTQYPELTPRQRTTGTRTILAAPLLSVGAALGVIMIRRVRVNPFTSRQIALLKTFADQAVIAIANERLVNQLEVKNDALVEALDQQTATAEILRVISSAPVDLQPVFDAIVRNAVKLCGAAFGGLHRLDGDRITLEAQYGIPTDELAILQHDVFPIPLSRESATGRAILDRTVAHIRDIRADADFRTPRLKMMQDYRTVLAVPLVREGAPIGALALWRPQVRPFTKAEIGLVQTFADQAVIAIENVRLFKELQTRNADLTEALEQQTATSEILRAISSSPTDLQPVLDTVVKSAARFCGAYDVCIFRLDGDHLRLDAHHGPVAQPDGFLLPVVKGSVGGRTVLERRVIHVADLPAETAEFPEAAANARRLGFRTILSVPLVREGVAIGAIQLRRPESVPFTDKQVSLLQTFSDQAVIAIENVRLFTELQEKNRALTQAHAQVTEALEQQTATSGILRVISQSPTDVQPVFETIAASALRLCGAKLCTVFRFDGELIHLAALHHVSTQGIAAYRDAYPAPPGRSGGTHRAILTGTIVHIPDIREDPEYELQALARTNDFRCVLSVPMLRDGHPIGAITVGREAAGPFPDVLIELLKTFADQAVIAIENVRLFRELEARNRDLTAALDRQTATAEVLRVISQSQTEVQPVFDAIVDNVIRLFRARAASVLQSDGQLIHLIAARGGLPGSLEYLRGQSPWPIHEADIVGHCIADRAVVHIPDTESDPALEETMRDLARTRGWRSVLAAPMLRDGQPIGAITITRAQAGSFSSAEIELVQTFADQAVIAIENARLLGELQARTGELTRSVEQLTALGEVGRAVSSTLDLETVLTTIVARAVQLSGLDGGVVFEYDEGADEFVQRAATDTGGALAEARRATRIRKGEGALGRTAITLEPVQVPDITVPGAHESRLRDLLIESGVRAVLAVPMVREGRLIGCIGVTRNRTGEFPAETIELLRTFATQSALAIQNARLFHEIADKSRQLEAASRHKSEFLANMSHELRTPLNAVIGFSEVLLQRMFGELNAKQDEYLQDIYASGQHLLSLINDILDLSKIEAGHMELAPAPFHLPSALENAVTLVKERAGRHGIALHLDIDPELGVVVGDERKIKQVLVNLLSNAVKFTPEGGRISLRAGWRDGVVEIAVADTGIGIDPEDQAAIFEEFRQVGSDERKREGTGLGLTLAKKFVELHGGRIWVESEPGRGSTFTVTLPVA